MNRKQKTKVEKVSKKGDASLWKKSVMIFFALICLYQKVMLSVHGDAFQKDLIPGAFQSEQVAVRIVGGQITNIDKYPFIVSIQRRLGSHFCGGTYVAPRFVLSAAHCMVRGSASGKWSVFNPRMYYVIAGSTNVYFPDIGFIQLELIDRILPHKDFRFAGMQNDIGLFRLRRPFHINDHVQFVRVPGPSELYIPEYHRGHCSIIGWGRTKAGSNAGAGTKLRHANVSLIPVRQCSMPDVVVDMHLCAGAVEGGRDACQGDSGGPLMCGGIQVGIVSWGIGCGEANRPGVYCRVDHYLEWINSSILKNSTLSITLNSCILPILVLYYFCTCNNKLYVL